MCYQKLVIFIVIIQLLNSDAAIIQLHALIRHGERTPTETYPTDPYLHYNWTEGWGSLTNRGKLQLYELGQKFRKKYSDFIPKYYWPNDINVTSSYSNRCKNSAALFCAGLYPPMDFQKWTEDLLWQPIPVNDIPRGKDTIIVMRVPCPKYDTIFAEVKNSIKVNEIINKNRNLLEYLTKHTGKSINTIEDVELLYNTLEIEQINNLTLPQWLNQSMLATMKELGAINLALYSETPYMKRMKGGMFLKNVFSSIDNTLKNITTKKIHLYFGHDLSLVHVLRTLNIKDVFKPGFGAYLTIELHSDHVVKIAYSNSAEGPEELELFYYLTDLKESLNPVLPSNYELECQLDT